MSVLSAITSLIGPAAKLIDDLHTSEEEKATLANQALITHYAFVEKLMLHEQHMMKCKADIIKAESTNSSWLANSWRPITMLSFAAIVIAEALGFTIPLNDRFFDLLELGLGGYIVGRSAEKIAGKIIDHKRGL